MLSELNGFHEIIQSAQDRLNMLYREAEEIKKIPNSLLPEMFQELSISLEELQVAEEELYQQNETLADTRLQVEQERQRYQDLFDFAPDGYIVTNGNGIISAANRVASQMLGVSPQYLASKPITAFIAPEARKEFRRRLNSCQIQTPAGYFETTVLPRNRRSFPAVLSVSILRESQDKPVHLRWIIRDNTERKQWEEKLNALNSELDQRVRERTAELEASIKQLQWERAMAETLVAAAPTPMAFMDAELRFVKINESLARINGRLIDDHLGKTLQEVLPQEHWKAVEPFCRRALSGEAVVEAEVSGPKPAALDQTGYYLCSFYPVQVEGETIGVGTTLRDVTERRLKERDQEEAFRSSRTIADTLQSAMLQTVSEDAFPNLSISTLYKAASDEALVGGDFFDAFAVDHGKVALVVGDVSGKGLAAASHTAEIKFALRAFLRETPSPSQALARLNDFICETQRLDNWGNHSLIVLAIAVVDPATGEVTYASAGAEPLLVLPQRKEDSSVESREQDIREYGRSSGLVLGIQPKRTYVETGFFLIPGESILMTTDGITEARSGKEMLDLEGLKHLAAKASCLESVGEISRAILEETRSFAGGALADDACLLLARWHS